MRLGDDDDGESVSLSRLVNLPFFPSNDNVESSSSSSSSSVLPGPFVVLQGSPGDGMANTIDTMPMLPPESTPLAPAPVVNSNGSGGGGKASRRNSATSGVHDRIPDMVLEELDSEVSAESGEEKRQADLKQAPSADVDAVGGRLRSRPRSDSDTEGGLHLPLGGSSPLMRNAHHGVAAALAENFMSNRYSSSPSLKGRELFEQGKLASDEDDDVDDDDDDEQLASSGSPSGLNKSKRNGEEAEKGDVQPTKAPAEVRAVRQWEQECRRQELLHLEESNQNVELLLQRRRRSQERSRMVQRQIEGISGGRSESPRSSSSLEEASFGISLSNRPLNIATALVAARPASRPARQSASASALAAASRASAAVAREKEKEEDPLDGVVRTLELAKSHRQWYQRDGRLMVLKSLPHLSSRGAVIAQPVADRSPSKSPPKSAAKSSAGDVSNSGGVVTLAPGCTVMAESAFVLDSRTLRQLHPAPPKTRSQSKSPIRNDSSNDCNVPKLCFLKITSPHSGYVLSNVHSYPLLLPGLPTTYARADRWMWRVTCQPDGAFVRSGLELVTDHIGTLPYGAVCEVKRKAVNGMGLNRLEVEARLPRDAVEDRKEKGNDKPADAFGMVKFGGYISEFLNPLSGQRGNVVEPIPFPVPALYKVVHAKGCVIRSGVELSTSQIGHAPQGAIFSVVGRAFSDHPSHGCLERLRLAGGGGWISVTLNRLPPGNDKLVEMTGVDGGFDPNDPARFHFESVRRVMEELHANNNNNDAGGDNGGGAGGGGRSFRRLSSYADLSEIGDDDAGDPSRGRPSLADDDDNASSLAAVPTLFRSGSCLPGSAMDAVRESSSDAAARHHQRHDAPGSTNGAPNRCLICLSDERTATIVHGETGHIACCLTCARILKARGDSCPVCRLPIDLVIQQFWA